MPEKLSMVAVIARRRDSRKKGEGTGKRRRRASQEGKQPEALDAHHRLQYLCPLWLAPMIYIITLLITLPNSIIPLATGFALLSCLSDPYRYTQRGLYVVHYSRNMCNIQTKHLISPRKNMTQEATIVERNFNFKR